MNAGWKNLRPNPGGEVRNPEGRNQYTYKADFEAAFAKVSNGPISDAELEKLGISEELAGPLRAMFPDGLSRGEAFAFLMYARALGGEKRAYTELLARLLPKTERHEHSGNLDISGDSGALLDRLARLAASDAASGDPGEPPAGGTGGSE